MRAARAKNGSVRTARVENLRGAPRNLEGAEFWRGASRTGRKSQRGSEKLGEVEFWKWRMENEKGIKGFVL